MWWAVVSLVLFWSCQTSAVSVSCKDENNNDVDWYILYKAPYIPNVRSGQEYIYIDATGMKEISSPGPGPSTAPPYKPISATDGVLANTLAPMLVQDMPPTFGFLSYSDQPPGDDAKGVKFGHSKGVVLKDNGTQTALWLTHSTPQFPFKRDQNNFWPSNGNKNAQTFMCVSLKDEGLQTVEEHLQRIRAFPFDHKDFNDLYKKLRDPPQTVPSDSLLGQFKDLKTKDNRRPMKVMAKKRAPSAKAGDLYVVLAAGLNSDVLAQTWGGPNQTDKDYIVTNQKSVKNVMEITTVLGTWGPTKDHSKWAVATDNNKPWTCISDMNRAKSQYERWGGALCIQDKDVNGYFKKFVTDPDDSKPTNPKQQKMG